MERETLLNRLLALSPGQFVEEFLFDRIPHIFSGSRQKFIDWKRILGEKIDVDPACITLVGSAATGISLNPNKNFKAFGEDSDVDVAVVSSLHFNIAWRYLRMNGNCVRFQWPVPQTIRRRYKSWRQMGSFRYYGVFLGANSAFI